VRDTRRDKIKWSTHKMVASTSLLTLSFAALWIYVSAKKPYQYLTIAPTIVISNHAKLVQLLYLALRVLVNIAVRTMHNIYKAWGSNPKHHKKNTYVLDWNADTIPFH
jgi:hypothetical protein